MQFVHITQHRKPEMFSCPTEGNTMHAETIDAAITQVMDGTRKDGGHTASGLGIPVPATGYMVGGYVQSLIFDESVLRDNEHNDIVWRMIFRWAGTHVKRIIDPEMFLGGWIDTDEQAVYIDLSRHFTNRRDAIHAAIDNAEIAIWDLAANAEIRIP
jgi:hypothetical protein